MVIKLVKGYINNFAGQSNDRTGKVNFNIIMSFVLRAVSIAVSFLTISFSLDLLDANNYGIWLAISSTVAWINVLDIGLTNGLRNKVAEYLALNDYKEAKIAVSSTYAILTLIIVPTLLIFGLLLKFVNWNAVFNTSIHPRELALTIGIAFTGLLLQFFLKPITSILQGDQEVYKANVIQLFCNCIPLLPIIFLSKYLHGSMPALAVAQTMLPVIVLLLASIFYFYKDYAQIRPSVKYVDFAKSKSLFGLSFAFFILQISGVFLYSTTELIITRQFGGTDVTLFNLLYKYFSTTTIIINIVLTSYWSAFTNAFALADIGWINSSLSKLLKIAALLLVVTVVQLLVVKPVFNIWVGEQVDVPFVLSAVMMLYFGVNLFTTLYSIVLNGTGKVKVQAVVSLLIAAVHVPAVMVFIKVFHWGLNSLVYASLLWSVIQVFVWRHQINSVLKRAQKQLATQRVPEKEAQK